MVCRRSHRATILFFACIALVSVVAGGLSAQELLVGDDVPAWIALERADDAARPGPGRDYAAALRLYSRALEVQPIYPEAYVGMARVFRAEGDTVLAEQYYHQALEQVASLTVPEEEYALRLELAEMYRQIGREEDYRNALQRIINRDPVFADTSSRSQRTAMRERLYEAGLNRVLVLYRLDFPQSLAAHRNYADYLLQRDQQIDRAVEHLLFSVVEIGGRAVEAVIDREFDYQFTSIADLLLTARRYPEVQQYLDEMDFIGLLLKLAAALDGAGPNGAQRAATQIREELQATLSLQR